jgi:hypothetical protein
MTMGAMLRAFGPCVVDCGNLGGTSGAAIGSQELINALSRDEAIEGCSQISCRDVRILRAQRMPTYAGPTRSADHFLKLGF